MTFQHLKFDQLSELLDDDITEDIREKVMNHLDECPLCNEEYQTLNRCMYYVSELKCETFMLPDLCENTMTVYRAKMRRKHMFRMVPAIAASVLIVAGAGVSISGYFSTPDSPYIAESADVTNETQRIISSIRDSEGRILKMNGRYIDGAVKTDQVAGIEKLLKNNKLKYKLYRNPVFAYSKKSSRNLEDVSLSSGAGSNSSHPEFQKIVKEKDTVIIRIFR